MHDYKQIDMSKVQTYSIKTRDNKVNVKDHFASPVKLGQTFSGFLDQLPGVLGAETIKSIVESVVKSHRNGRPVIAAIGGHVIKCGLQPVLKSLIEAGVISAVAMNGSAAIHDYEVSLAGATSEDVGAVLHSGDFGFSDETGGGINTALKQAEPTGVGFGEAVGRAIINNKHPYSEYSLLAACAEADIPCTVHVAVGTDIIHQHPTMDGAVTGEMSYRDFRLLTSVVADLSGGAWLNIGSAVIMPEVFLKALSIAQNLGHHVEDFTTANFDMIRHYRTQQNVVSRPVSGQGKGYNLIGHHEINIPLFAQAVIESLATG